MNWSQGSNSYQFNFDGWATYNEEVELENAAQDEYINQIEEFQKYCLDNPVEEVHIHGGSKHGRIYKPRNREHKQEALMQDYFVENPVFDDEDFRRRFRMKKQLFLNLVSVCERENPYFQQKLDGYSKPGFTALQKVTVAIHMLAYGYSSDVVDNIYHMSETTACDTVRQFCATILRIYKKQYLRAPNDNDLKRLLAKAEQRGFPGMIGSLDCMHWTWKNCPTAWTGSFSGRSTKPTIVLEAVASSDTWIWHAFFGVPRDQNDLIVLARSPLFDDLASANSPKVKYMVNGTDYFITYYLADDIYPKWATLVQSIKNPSDRKEALFSKLQESYRKDVERAFGILQSRFAIVKQPGRGWNTRDLGNIMMTCIVLHNMIVEDERDEYVDEDSDEDDNDHTRSRRARAIIYDQNGSTLDLNPRTSPLSLEDYMMRRYQIQSIEFNHQLQTDLVEHVWATNNTNSGYM